MSKSGQSELWFAEPGLLHVLTQSLTSYSGTGGHSFKRLQLLWCCCSLVTESSDERLLLFPVSGQTPQLFVPG